MIKKQTYSLFLFLSTIIIAIILSFLVDGSTLLIRFINSLFYLALLYIIIGGFLHLTEKGFFNVTKYAFKKTLKRNEDKLLEEKIDKNMIYERKMFSMTIPLLVNGITFAIVTTIIGFLLI